ncbi:MAG TPA: peptidoglycan DD-metalloendopeptidase family protein [Nocardioidaceae bacterium]|nr:peptidoglycan DD-metalloendopeptidase family protein [Nocardioidaceae bacterium]
MLATIRVHDRHSRRCLIAVLVALSAALSLAVVPSSTDASANELDDRKRRVHRDIDRAKQHLRHSSKALVRATERVEKAEARLEEAERELEARRAQLAAAEVVDAQMQSELDAATARLRRAQAALARGRRSHRTQQEVLRTIASETYQVGSPGLMGLTLVLTSRDPSELSTQLNVVRNVLDRETATLQRLEASSLLLELQEARVADARKDVADRRRAAAETLEQRRRLEIRAAVASARVEQLVEERTAARKQALRSKEADQRRLRQLRNERDKITRLIKQREARIRRQKSKAEIARAKKASQSRTSPMRLPVDTYVTSRYGMRLHPIYRQWRLHDGTDFGARCGRPVRAAAGGRVIGRYYNVGYGNRVIIAHGYLRGASITTTYNHLSRYSTYVGQRVRKGEIIGFVGTTGFSTGCHLHFMVFRNGRTVDPMNWL